MLDPGRYFAEAIYFLQYTLAQILWAMDRALLSIAVITESINQWITTNVGYFVQLLVNGLSAPLGGMFILALTALGCWYALNHFLPTDRWVDPSKLFTYGLIAFFFFASPIMVIELMEELRLSLFAGIDQALIDGAAGDIFTTDMNGTDLGLPPAIGDVNSDGVVGSFDLVAAFMAVANLDELDSSEFPVDFEATYFPFGDPAAINLSDEADQELAKALASDGIERLFFAFFAVPTAIGEHFLRLALTGVAMLLYLGVPIAMLFAFFVSTQAFLGAYLRQFINLLIETFLSVVITAILIGLLTASAQQGIGLFIGASVVTCFVLAWRIQSGLRLAGAALDLFGGAMLTGGVGGGTLAANGARLMLGGVQLAGAALTGGASLAVGGAVLAAATRAQTGTGAGGGSSFGTAAGYVLGQSSVMRRVIEGVHEARTLARHTTQGAAQPQSPDGLDYLRAGASLSELGSSPWLAMRLSPSLRAAYDQLGGSLMGPWPAGGGNGAPVSPPMPSPMAAAPPRPEALVNHPTVEEDRTAHEPTSVDGLPLPPTLNPANGALRSIRLEVTDAVRQAAIDTVLVALNETATPTGRDARQALATRVGATNAGILQAAVAEHGPETVQLAAAAVAAAAQVYRDQGMEDAGILTTFQQGEAFTALRQVWDTPLRDDQLVAVADLTLLPQRRLTRTELVTIIGQQAVTDQADDQTVAAAIGLPPALVSRSFGAQTGAVRGVLANAQAMALSASDLVALVEQLQRGQYAAAQAALIARGGTTDQTSELLSDLAALPGMLTIPQTTASFPLTNFTASSEGTADA